MSDGPPFEALGHAGSDAYVGLEKFDNPGCLQVKYTSDEVMAKCPVTGQPDFYTVTIFLEGTEKLIESKSLKLFFNRFIEQTFTLNTGIFCENLAVWLRDQVCEAIGAEEESVEVLLTQKSRGGITIEARA